MKKQTKLVAVLSTASLLAIGASMTSFAATGWVEEDGTWVYYNRDGERATNEWKKSGNSWYYLDDNGEMAIDQLIEDDDNYYYVDINGVMATNQWVALENEDAGDADEPDQNWYYFQANGKALTNGNNDGVSLKTINGKKYAFDDEGKMLWGWVNADSAEHLDNTDGDAFKDGDYYFGGSDDGAMTVGWLQMDVTYDETTSDTKYMEISPVFTDDEDQTRWFYFRSNGKKVYAENGDEQKSRTINGRKYEFDQYGAMTAEWSLDVESAEKAGVRGSYSGVAPASKNDIGTNSVPAKYAQQWRYFNSVEDGARVSKNWFKVVSAEYLNEDKYNDDEEAWYYADGSGNLYAGEMKTIKGKKYAFRDDGRMISGLKFIRDNKKYDGFDVAADDDPKHPFDTEDDFIESSNWYEKNDYKCYYFGDAEDGAMRTGRTTITIDGDNYTFEFEKSGSKKGQGVTDVDDDKIYQSGMLLKAGSDEKYQVVVKLKDKAVNEDGEEIAGYKKLDDVDTLKAVDENKKAAYITYNDLSEKADAEKEAALKKAGVNKKGEDIDELYIVTGYADGYNKDSFKLVNTSGKIMDDSKYKDGEDYYYVLDGEQIVAIYTEE